MPVNTNNPPANVFHPSRILDEKTLTLKSSLTEAREKINDLTSHLERIEFEGKLLREINTAITSTFELPEILSLILQVLTTLVNTQGVSMLLVNHTDNTLRIAESHGLSTNDIENFYIHYAKLNTGIFHEIFEQKAAKFFDGSEGLAIPMLISVPLISRNRVIGFLNIHSMYKNRPLTSEKIDLVYALASQASIAISNAQMFSAMREQAIIDQCTGLYNFRFFQQKLDEELELADKSSDKLCLVILDIDYFKHVNDTWGHPYGDKVLRELANLLKNTVRIEDTVCRYGGEEFAIIFPGCETGLTYKISERIRTRIEETSTNDRRSVFREPITVSMGIAQYRSDMNKTTLIEQADLALYWAKNNGRNNCHIYDSSLVQEYKKN